MYNGFPRILNLWRNFSCHPFLHTVVHLAIKIRLWNAETVCLYLCRGFINIRKGHKIKIIIINKVFSTHCDAFSSSSSIQQVNNNRTWMSLESFGHAYIIDYIMNITIELFFSAPSRWSTLLYVHDKHTAK